MVRAPYKYKKIIQINNLFLISAKHEVCNFVDDSTTLNFLIKDFFRKYDQTLDNVDLLTFTEEIFNEEPRFLCSATYKCSANLGKAFYTLIRDMRDYRSNIQLTKIFKTLKVASQGNRKK